MSEIWRKGVLAHHGIKGQKWGVRRFQNEDGSLTPAGKSRYYNEDGSLTKEGRRHNGGVDHDTSHLSPKQKKQYDKLLNKWDKVSAKLEKVNDKIDDRFADPADGFKNLMRFLTLGVFGKTTGSLQEKSSRLQAKRDNLSDKMYKLAKGKDAYKKMIAKRDKAIEDWLNKETERLMSQGLISHSDEPDGNDLRDLVELLKEDETKDMIEALNEKDRADFLARVASVLTSAGVLPPAGVLPDFDDGDNDSTTEDGVDGE